MLLEVLQELEPPKSDADRRLVVRCLLGQLLLHWAGQDHGDGGFSEPASLVAMLNCLVWQSEAAFAEVTHPLATF